MDRCALQSTVQYAGVVIIVDTPLYQPAPQLIIVRHERNLTSSKQHFNARKFVDEIW